LHIIIFDELDAIFKQRGSTNSGTGVGDTVVNQVLSKMDGVDQLNNIQSIGETTAPNGLLPLDSVLTLRQSLRLAYELQGTFKSLNYLLVNPSETNLLGTRTQLGGIFSQTHPYPSCQRPTR